MKEDISGRGVILITGATGYIGGRLIQTLESLDYPLRCMARRPEALESKVEPSTEIVKGDVLDRSSLDAALQGVSVAYYLVHSMESKGSFEEDDRNAALNFGEAAKAAGVERIIYLGGLGEEDEDLSPHLRSRQEVGHILRQSGVPVLEFRASIVLGSGSISFEMIRSLVEKLPIMVTPRWVSISAQPIAIDDLIAYLVAALNVPTADCRVYEIGGSDQMSYADIMKAYAKHRNLRILMIPVPVLTPFLSSLWLGLVTPLYARVGRKLIEGIVHPTVVHDESAAKVFDIQPMGVDEAVGWVLAQEDREFEALRWSEVISSSGRTSPWFGKWFGPRVAYSKTATITGTPPSAFKPIQQIGGDSGWYAFDWLWRLRGFLDRLVGGVGMRRGRKNPATLRVGDEVDFWRIEAYEPDRRLRLLAEMKLPGRAWLEYEVTGDASSSTIWQTLIFDPRGLFGRVYWYLLYPLHVVVLNAMLRGIVNQAIRSAEEID